MIRISGVSLCIVVCTAALSVWLSPAVQAARTAPSTLDIVRRAVADQAELQVDEVNADATMADLGLDDLDVVEVVMAVEDELGIEISDDELVTAAGGGDAAGVCERLTVRAFAAVVDAKRAPRTTPTSSATATIGSRSCGSLRGP